MILEKKEDCCGCTSCYNICPQNCIKMIADSEGFMYPHIDNNQCVNCGLCKSVCPVICEKKVEPEHRKVYVTQSKNKEALKECTSGGFIDALLIYMMEQGCEVVAVKYDDNWTPVHRFVNDVNELNQFRGSKYAQSELGTIFNEVRIKLEKGVPICFVGTPCQVAGLKSFLQKDYSNLILVDLVCRSIPSVLVWKEYLKWQSNRFDAEISDINCRSKLYGYRSGALTINFNNGKRYAGSNRVDYFMKAFHSDLCSRPSCYNCAFKTIDRISDYTVFDSWKPEELNSNICDKNEGYSNVIIHTQKGYDLMQKLNIEKWEADLTKALSYTGGMAEHSISMPVKRKIFYTDLIVNGFEKTMKKYVAVSLMDKIIEFVKPILFKIGLWEKIKK